MSEATDDQRIEAVKQEASLFISTVHPSRRERRLAFAVVLGSLLAFLGTAPFAQVPLTAIPAFLPAYQAAIIIGDVITFILLLGQYDILRSRGLFVIACGYLFNAAMAIFHALSFPGLFAPSGLLNSGPQTTAWLYFFWHGTFPLFVIAYVVLKGKAVTSIERRIPLALAMWIAVIIASGLASAFMLLATTGAGLLPPIMSGNMDADKKIFVALAVWIISLVALALLWLRKPHSLLDMWLMVIMLIWILDVALAAVLNHGRYDVGWYMGRAYGLMAASFVLIALLLENGKLYVQLVSGSARERAYLNNLYDPVVTIDARGRIRNANPALERVLGYSAEELLGRNVSVLMPEPQKSEHDGYIRRYLQTGNARIIGTSREVTGQHKNGELIPLELSITEFSHDEESFFIGTLRDLRDRNRLIDELTKARADADQANRAKSAFLATMSHEIRTPMNGVLGMLEVLEHSSLTEHQRDQVQTMRDSGATLMALIDDILDFSKIEAGRIELERAPLCVADLVEGLCTSQLSVARRRGVVLRVFVAPDIPESVLGDDTRLRQVLYNLVGNAIKFSAGNPARAGRVEVRATLAARAPLRIAFTVKDNGIGMDEAARSRLFTPFTQAEASTTRRFGGTGLGLTICRRLVNLMGGEIGVISQPGEGSLFTATLPFALAPERPAREQPGLSGLFCFLLDDADIDAEALTEYLEHAGATVRPCGDVADAVRFAAAAESPVILIHAEGESRRWQDGELSTHLRRVRIGHGRRRRARLDAPDCVSIDGDALRRLAFLRAVAVAAGRASPEIFDDRSTDVLPGESSPPPTVAQARAENRLILVAEDDSVNQKVILQQLALLGYAAEVAGDGAEALARWSDGGFALLFTDLHMPAMDGYQLAAEIRRREGSGRRMPIIALTANALSGEAARAKA
ncbi:MAG: ATP-binding protein, partial [Sulfuritalea sp.]|nr:ATP-binding protein [Sulfuritalea sp.]